MEVGAELGRISGRNLFHSFERFGVDAGGRVTFTGPDGLDNIVSRVTGGEASRIDGTLASRVPGADLYLVNPAGIIFGPGGRLDVPGSFHASTADELRFRDGTAFSARDPSGATLSVAAPHAFGFLGGRPVAGVTVERGLLAVPAGRALSLVGGDVAVAGGAGGVVQASGGTVALVAVGGTAPTVVGPDSPADGLAGAVALTEGALIDASGEGGGLVRIQGARLTLDGGSRVLANTLGAGGPLGGVVVDVGETLLGAGAEIASDALPGSTGDAGDVVVRGRVLTQGAATIISSSTFGEGNAGDVLVSVDRLSLLGGGPGLRARITSTSEASATGDAGRVIVTASDVELRRVASIDSTTFGSGDAGTIEVTARGLLLVDGEGDSALTGVTSQTNAGSTGNGGRLTVEAGRIELRNAAVISSNTGGSGRAGSVRIDAGRLVAVGGVADDVFTGVESRSGTNSSGDGGSVSVWANEIELRDTGAISTSTLGGGNAGEVSVVAGRLLIEGGNFTEVASGAQAGSFGDAGNVRVDAGEIELRAGGAIQSDNMAVGRAGNVLVTAGRLTILDGGVVGSSAAGTEPAGDVRVRAGRVEVDGGGIRTVGSGAQGGRITVAADEAVVLREADVSSNGILPEAGASLITVEAPLIALNDSRVTSLTEGRPIGGSGEASLLGDATVISVDSLVAASSSVVTTGLETELGAELGLPASSFLSADSLLGQSCAARRTGGASSFTREGRGGLPASPDRPLGSTAAEAPLRVGDALRTAGPDCDAAGNG